MRQAIVFEAQLLKKPLFSFCPPSLSLHKQTVLYRQLNRRSTLGHTDNPNLVFLILPPLIPVKDLDTNHPRPFPSLSLLSHRGCDDSIFCTLSSPPHRIALLQSHYYFCAIRWLFSRRLCRSHLEN